jgi:hypothetical protein
MVMFKGYKTHILFKSRFIRVFFGLILVTGISVFLTSEAYACHHMNDSAQPSYNDMSTHGNDAKVVNQDKNLTLAHASGTNSVDTSHKNDMPGTHATHNCCKDRADCGQRSICQCNIPLDSDVHHVFIRTSSPAYAPNSIVPSRAPPLVDALRTISPISAPYHSEALFLAFDQWLL